MKTKLILISAALAVLLLVRPGAAQLPGGGQGGMNAALLKLFGEFPAFTSRADVRLQEKPSRATTTLVMDFAMLDGRVRMELDMDAVKSTQVPPSLLVRLKAAGLNKLITVMEPSRKSILLIYPGAQAFAEIPMAKDEAADTAKRFRIEKARISTESIDGHSCEKTKVVLRSDAGDKQEALVWYAKDLGDFPLRIQFDQPDATVVMDYRDVKLARLDSKKFEAPSGFVRYLNVEALMQTVMFKAMGGKK
jgi:hypothetical protein